MIRAHGIDLAETMAFGDGQNDIEMLRHAGIGVAMGNAADEVKRSADYVTTGVDRAGIAKALRHFDCKPVVRTKTACSFRKEQAVFVFAPEAIVRIWI